MQDQNQNPGTEIATLPPAQRAVIALDSTTTEKQLRELATYSAGIVSVTDKDSREEAHRAGMNLKNARVSIGKIGKAAREDAKAFCDAVIAEEKRLVALVAPEEERVLGLRDAFDAEQARLKAEAEAKEKARVAAIKAKIEAIKGLPAASFGDSAEQIGATLADLEAFALTEADFAEFALDASTAQAGAISTLRGMHARVLAAEAEAARLAEERAEIERQRAAAAQAERQAAEARKAEEDRLRAEREALEAERREMAQLRAEQERIAAEQEAARPAPVDPAPVVEIAPEPVAVPANDDVPVTMGVDLAASPDKTVYFDDLIPAEQVGQQAEATFRDAVQMLLRHRTTEQARIIFDEELQRHLAAA